MPELPDLVRFQHYLQSTALRQTILRTSARDDRILRQTTAQGLGRQLKGQQLTGAERHGKYLFARGSRYGWLTLHFGMTGELKYQRRENDKPRFTRMTLTFEDGARLHYLSRRILGEVRFVKYREEFIEQQQLGPDALDSELKPADFQRRCEDRRGMIKPLLMNQRFIAGLGNMYADEVLFQAGLRPDIPAEQMDGEVFERLYKTLRRVMQVAARHEGIVADLPSDYLLPHREGDRRCPACGRPLEEKTVSGRTGVFCRHCQH